MKIGIVVFPGSNCDKDVHHVLRNLLHADVDLVWHAKEDNLRGYGAVVLPGGFAHGDRLRGGVIAAFSPVVKQVMRLASDGVPILGVCNGFQILVESGLLPGALMANNSLKFVCRWTNITVESSRTPFTHALKSGQKLRIPVANHEGRYYADQETIKALEDNDQIVFRYHDADDDPNGSASRIAGICNEQGNVVGMMPHPERASECMLSPFNSEDGILIFKSMLSYLDEEQHNQ